MENDQRYIEFHSTVKEIYEGRSVCSRDLSKIIRSVISLIDDERKDSQRDLINLDKFMNLACYVKTLNSSLNNERESCSCGIKESSEVIGEYLKNQESIFRKYST